MRNKTNVNYEKIQYEIEGNKTKCYLTYYVDLTKWPMQGLTMDASTIVGIVTELGCTKIHFCPVTFMPIGATFLVESTATCDTTTDTYDEETGKHIALTRAQAKAFDKTLRLYAIIVNKIDKIAEEVERFAENNYSAYKKCCKHAAKLGGY